MLILVSAAVALIAVAFAAFRRERSLYIYAAAYVCAGLGSTIMLWQGSRGSLLSVSAASLLDAAFQLCLAWGLRTSLGHPRPWPRRFGLYLAICLLCQILFGGASMLRAASMSLFAILLAAEFLVALEGGRPTIAAFMRRSAWVVALVYMGGFMLRFILILAFRDSGAMAMDQDLVGSYTVGLLVFFSVLWGGLVIGLDISALLGELERRNRSLAELATTDKLTGLGNRHHLESVVAAEMERAGRYPQPLSLVLLDLDHFKHVNDAWGHERGDGVLVRAASLSRGMIRDTDRIFRWGGEEFLVLAPHTDLDGAAVLAEKIRRALSDELHPKVGTVTASLGVTQWKPGEGLGELFRRVDRALYRAKRGGRNRVACLGPEEYSQQSLVRLELQAELESGNRLIDDEHRVLLELAQDFLDLPPDSPPSTLGPYFQRLIDTAVRHFADEEGLLSLAAFPRLAEHAELHRRLVAELNGLGSRLLAGQMDLGEFCGFLVDDLILGHIQAEDVKFFALTRVTGPKGAARGMRSTPP